MPFLGFLMRFERRVTDEGTPYMSYAAKHKLRGVIICLKVFSRLANLLNTMLSLPFARHTNRHLILGRIGKFPFAPLYKIPYSALRSHLHIIGRSGNGKSKALEHIVYQHIVNGIGCGVIDPHGTLIDDLLRYLITHRVLDDPEIRNRIIYIDPTRTDYVIPFNVLSTQDEPYKVVALVLEAFRRTFLTLQAAPHFENLMTHALLVLIKCHKTLMDLTRLLVDQQWREELLAQAGNPKLTSFFHDRYDRWGREAPMMRESTLNKVTAFALNPYLEVMLGQPQNRLDMKALMDEGKIFLLNLGKLDTETNRLLGSLIMTSFELAMFRRENTNLWPLTVDEFASYMGSDASVTTMAHILSQARKFGLGLCVSHQTLSQLTPTMLGALGNTDTRMVFSVDRNDAEFFAKAIGRVDTEAIKREPKTESQHEVFSPLPEQWEEWTDTLRFQQKRQMVVSTQNGKVASLWAVNIPQYTASEEDVENIRRESGQNYGIPYEEAKRNIEVSFTEDEVLRASDAPISDRVA